MKLLVLGCTLVSANLLSRSAELVAGVRASRGFMPTSSFEDLRLVESATANLHYSPEFAYNYRQCVTALHALFRTRRKTISKITERDLSGNLIPLHAVMKDSLNLIAETEAVILTLEPQLSELGIRRLRRDLADARRTVLPRLKRCDAISDPLARFERILEDLEFYNDTVSRYFSTFIPRDILNRFTESPGEAAQVSEALHMLDGIFFQDLPLTNKGWARAYRKFTSSFIAFKRDTTPGNFRRVVNSVRLKDTIYATQFLVWTKHEFGEEATWGVVSGAMDLLGDKTPALKIVDTSFSRLKELTKELNGIMDEIGVQRRSLKVWDKRKMEEF